MQHYLLYPFNASDLNNKVFESPYGILRDLLRERGIDLQTVDKGDLASADAILSLNHHSAFLQQCEAVGVPVEKRTLFLYEPEVVVPKQYQPKTWESYGKIFTYRDDLVDGKKLFKMRYPQGQIRPASIPSFAERRFMLLMNANKYSYAKNELYSMRRSAIRFFENANCGFDLYGYGWNDNNILLLHNLLSAAKKLKPFTYLRDVVEGLRHYRSYRGTVNDKPGTMAKYKFAICFENENHVPGWVSEKIFDCLFAGTIPIYLGASNIEAYVPAASFIDMRSFSGFDKLLTFLQGITPAQFATMQAAGQAFLDSPEFSAWTPTGTFQEIIRQLV